MRKEESPFSWRWLNSLCSGHTCKHASQHVRVSSSSRMHMNVRTCAAQSCITETTIEQKLEEHKGRKRGTCKNVNRDTGGTPQEQQSAITAAAGATSGAGRAAISTPLHHRQLSLALLRTHPEGRRLPIFSYHCMTSHHHRHRRQAARRTSRRRMR